jgi:hypothetical protein
MGKFLEPVLVHLWRLKRESMKKVQNVFEAILKYGHDEDFNPEPSTEFEPTEAPAGSQAKIDELRKRVELGLPLWHDADRVDYSGLTGAVRPRE